MSDSDDDLPIAPRKSSKKRKVQVESDEDEDEESGGAADAEEEAEVDDAEEADVKEEGDADDDSDDEAAAADEDEDSDDEDEDAQGASGAGDDSDDEDDDVPIGMLQAKKKKNGASVAVPKKAKAKAAPVPDSDSEDDVPISQLAKKKPLLKKRASETKAKSPAAKKAKGSDKPVKRALKAAPANKESVFYETLRGKLVQALLRRWWFAIEWPSKEAIAKPCAKGFEPLAAFPGVHLCTTGETVGAIQDHRDHSTCPSFLNLMEKDTEEIQALLKTAYEKQLAELEIHEPGGTLAVEVKREAALAAKIHPGKADKEAKQALLHYSKSK